jgi:hypothetical protein
MAKAHFNVVLIPAAACFEVVRLACRWVLAALNAS